MLRLPGSSHTGPLPDLTAADREIGEDLSGHLRVLAGEIGERHVWRYAALSAAADYIEAELAELGFRPRRQSFEVNEHPVRNIDAELPGTTAADEIIVVGAHYDTVPGCPGANDNGTGVAATLALARALRDRSPSRTLRFAAFVNEEPPFFQTSRMGSLVYARACRARREKLAGMLSLETIGFYSDEPGSQRYPAPLGPFYPDTGDFIAFVSNLRSMSFLRRTIGLFRERVAFPSEGLAAPTAVPGVGYSDQWSFWQAGYPALMVTDTAPYRYPYYHTPEDSLDKIDIARSSRVVAGLVEVVAELAGCGPDPRTR